MLIHKLVLNLPPHGEYKAKVTIALQKGLVALTFMIYIIIPAVRFDRRTSHTTFWHVTVRPVQPAEDMNHDMVLYYAIDRKFTVSFAKFYSDSRFCTLELV